MRSKLLIALSPLVLLAASCGHSATGDSPPPASAIVEDAFKVEVLGTFDQPWAMAVLPGGVHVLVTEKPGKLKLWNRDGIRELPGAPTVDYGGQGGLGDVVLAPDFDKSGVFYLSWAEAGTGETRGAVVARGQFAKGPIPKIETLDVIWRQSPKVTGRGHYSHRMVVSPDRKYLYIASGDRQKLQPAQDPKSDLGKVIRLPIDAAGKPTGPAEQVSLGHRNILGLQFNAKGQLWEIEHGPAGGDELNLVKPGANYGWPVVSEGDHYSGEKIPRHSTRPDLAAPALSWTPVIAPGGMIFYSGAMWPEWKDQLLIGAMDPTAIVRVRIDGEKAREVARYPMDKRIRAVAQASDGSLYVLEDGKGGRLLKLTRK
ncbi:MAG: PQQ-dependent sugar dehydrogenase [Novosphingobium sp.]|nr:PQQ-dependent sugar dehydrogenase [Novosphingobium sp.]